MKINHYRHPFRFYAISLVIPWAIWFTAARVSHLKPLSQENMNLAIILGLIGLTVPMITAFVIMNRDPKLRSDLFSRIFNFREIKPVYLFLTAFLMLFSILLAQTISLLFGYSSSQFVISGHYSFSSGVFPVWFMLILAPVIEELGWHSYGTDCLRNRFNLFWTSLIFGAFWGLWHVPLSFIRDYYQSNLVETGWIYGVNFLVSIIPYVLIMNWLYYKTRRNIIVPIVFHITAGFFNEIFATHPDSKIIQTGLLLILAVILLAKEKEFFFSRRLPEDLS